MAGRKRKPGERTPSGQLSRADSEAKHAPTAIKRLTDSAIAAASDPRLGTELGRLLLAGTLTARQAGAGWQFAEASREYLAAIEAPSVKGATFERAAKGADAEQGTDAAERRDKALKRVKQRYERARACLDARGAEVSRAVRLLSEGRGVSLLTHEQLLSARDGLDALALHFATH